MAGTRVLDLDLELDLVGVVVTTMATLATMDRVDAAFATLDLIQAVVARIAAPGGLEGFREAVAHGGSCAHPVRLVGGVNVVDRDSGESRIAFSSEGVPTSAVWVSTQRCSSPSQHRPSVRSTAAE